MHFIATQVGTDKQEFNPEELLSILIDKVKYYNSLTG